MIIKKSNFYTISKYLICLLCCLMLFSLISRPIIAQASAVGTVAIGAYGVIKVVLSAKVLVGLIIGSFSGFVMSALLPDIDEWYESDSVIRNWADQYNGSISGGEVITIPASVQDSIRSRYDVNSSINISTLYVPYDLTHLEKVSAAHIFGTDVAAQLEANNTLLQQANRLLSQLVDSLESIATSLSEDIISKLSKSVDKLTTINSNITNRLLGIKGQLADLDRLLDARFVDVNYYLADIPRQLEGQFVDVKVHLIHIKNKFSDVNNNLVDIKESILGDLSTAINNLTSKLESGLASIETKIDSVVNSITDTATPPPPSVGSGNTGNTVNSGVNNGIAYFGNSNGILEEYATAFLVATMIFNLFVDISIFNKLLIVSASIGLVSVFLGIALHANSSESSAKRKAGKGG